METRDTYHCVISDVAASRRCPWPPIRSPASAMVEAAAHRGWIDRDRAIDETVTSIVRAGADVVLTYWALELVGRLR